MTEPRDAATRRDLDRRARLHAALADPGRLHVVDTLSLGDASPTELQEQLAMPSNLLAHHLRVLERAGLVTRHRSQGDRRRTYLRLVATALDGLLPTGTTTVPRIVFICTANSARSQLAAALWQRESLIPATSAGTHPAARVAAGATKAARRHGLRLAGDRPRNLDDVVQPDDYVVTVCDQAHEELQHQPDAAHRMLGRLHWSVPDPVPDGTADAFDAAYIDLAARVTALAPRLTNPEPSSISATHQ